MASYPEARTVNRNLAAHQLGSCVILAGSQLPLSFLDAVQARAQLRLYGRQVALPPRHVALTLRQR